MKKTSNKNKIKKIILATLIVLLLIGVISLISTLLLDLNTPAISVEDIQLSQSEVIFWWEKD